MFNKLSLCQIPTPLETMPRLGMKIGVETLLIKRDDLLGRGLGGSKLRKLEFIVSQALSQGADTLITIGSFESNHVALMSIVSRMQGLRPIVVLRVPTGKRSHTFNHCIQNSLEVETHIVEYVEGDIASQAMVRQKVDSYVSELVDKLTQEGHHPFFVPEGGCCLEGSYAFVEAFDELHKQMQKQGYQKYDIIVPVGSGSTYAGLWCGSQRAGAEVKIRGISIALRNPRCLKETRKATERVCNELGLRSPELKELDITDLFIGDGYAKSTEWSTRGIKLALRTEGLLLDHTYTGKALGAMITLLEKESPNHPVVFWHTGGVSGAVDNLFGLF
ncbi:pyridoxal-phosphate dependent enzyme [Candidatus Parabeggiatoa sp. HSG14]|uniref:1-aminocyclopropane-1-carboxylate deaminase/D-cysteine desulfhydrase n=1 Tax=Candidatus Parabeggiatoa sp. HSG14 TaxID=3055593 RepID=UPI0025A8D865|nr:pyridoxal-phosphate dependent enzyme [Thiotrichales bacterium HSG14]